MLELKFVAIKDRINLAAIAVMVVSLFGFLGNVMIDYNWGGNLVTNSIAVAYWMTLRWMIPLPLNYWGLGAVVYFVLFLFSFAVLNRKERLAQNLLETIRLASSILIMFELGVFYFVPGFMDKWVIQAVHGTPLASFTNFDLLAVALISTCASQLVLSWMRPRPRPASSPSASLVLEKKGSP